MRTAILNLYYFMIYSFVGWLVEVNYVFVKDGIFSNRGFLTGPFCAMYGLGAILIVKLLEKYKQKPIKIFFGSILIAGLVEYSTSYILESAFNLSLWDYSNYRLDLNGRIKLLNLLYFGALSLILVKFIHPKLEARLWTISPRRLKVFALIIMLYFVADLSLTLRALEQIDVIDLKNKAKLYQLNSAKENIFENILTKIK